MGDEADISLFLKVNGGRRQNGICSRLFAANIAGSHGLSCLINPNKLIYGASGMNTSSHLLSQQLKDQQHPILTLAPRNLLHSKKVLKLPL